MLRHLLLALLLLHGLIHLIAVAKAFGWARVDALPRPISRTAGLLWALACGLFLAAAVQVLNHSDRWWMPALAAVALSQALVLGYGRAARFGTVANALVLAAIVLGAAVWQFRGAFRQAVERAGQAALTQPQRIIAEGDLAPLPRPVQRFLRKAGVVGAARPRLLHMSFRGEIRGFTGPWMPFTTVQVNRFDVPERHFWMDATMKDLPTKGYHAYRDGSASMRVKVLGLVPVIDRADAELGVAETVTWFNDLCLFAPAALIDERITWEDLDDHAAKATFRHGDAAISAVLVFDAQDRLVDFISEDRSALMDDGTLQRLPWSTPASGHGPWGGLLLPSHGEAVYLRPDGPFTYGRFTLTDLAYDVAR